jgi:type II secretory pathway pseudopilin PulG
MYRSSRYRYGGIALVEVVIVVAVISSFAAVAVPDYLQARKRSQATMTLEILRQIDDAKDLYAIQYTSKVGKSPAADGVCPTCADLLPFAEPGSLMASQLTANRITDIFGREIEVNAIDQPPQITRATYDTLSDVVPRSFWRPYSDY